MCIPRSGNHLVDRHEDEDVEDEPRCGDCGYVVCRCDDMYELSRDE